MVHLVLYSARILVHLVLLLVLRYMQHVRVPPWGYLPVQLTIHHGLLLFTCFYNQCGFMDNLGQQNP